MGQLILETSLLDLDKPGGRFISTCGQDILGNRVKNVVFESADHTKQSKLLDVQDGLKRQRACSAACSAEKEYSLQT